MRSSPLPLLIVLLLAAAACGTDATPRSDGSAAADVAEIVCDGTQTIVRTRRVRTHQDGVHLRLVNESESPLSYEINDDRTGGRGGSVPVGASSHVVALAPGHLRVRCYDESEPDSGRRRDTTFDVVDSDGFWTPSVLECDGRTYSSTSLDYAPGTPGERGTAIEVAREHLQRNGLRAHEALERAGHPEVSPTLVRLVRNGAVVAVVSLVRPPGGGYLVEQFDRCEPADG